MWIHLCTNDLNGQFTDKLDAIDFGQLLHLESSFMPDANVTCRRVGRDRIRIGRRIFPIQDYVVWAGNWCWDAVKVDPPTVRYHVLEIEPLKRILRTEGKSEETGLKRALHICRGHFKDYREHGLFGKFKDIYWWDSQVRGNLSEGIVNKDYSVDAPK